MALLKILFLIPTLEQNGNYNIVKNPVDKIDYKELPLMSNKSIKLRKYRDKIWQKTKNKYYLFKHK